jgi:uncharacterized protein YkwD
LSLCASAQDVRALERRTFEAINRERRRREVPELAWNEALAKLARSHSARMAEKGFFSHQDPERGYVEDRLGKAGITWMRCAENLSQVLGYDDPIAEGVAGWLKSPGHRRNLLEREVTQTGVGVAIRGDGTYFFTQIFLLPRPVAR